MTTTKDVETRPRKLIAANAAGGQWGIAYKNAKRDEDDLCMGTKLRDDWEAIAAQIVAVPDMLAVLRAVAEAGDPVLKVKAKAALKKAGSR
jgi:hypothetical protein